MEKNPVLDKLRWAVYFCWRHEWTIFEVWDLIGTDWDIKNIEIQKIKDTEKQLIQKTLENSATQKEAAKKLGISERSMTYRKKKYDL